MKRLLAITFALILIGCGSVDEDASSAPGETTTSTTIAATTSTTIAVDNTTTTTTSTLAEMTTTSTTTTLAETTTSTTTTTKAPVVGVLTGAQRLADTDFERFAGQRIGLIAHQNSVVDTEGGTTHLLNAIDESANVELGALFGPEHGVRGTADAGVFLDDDIDPETGAPVFSLYGPVRQPSSSHLADIDVLFYDLQDVGTRYYTYISTMGLSMQAAAEANIPFVVLDRPNPLSSQLGGGVLEPANTSFVGQYAIPDIYGLTAGELANYIVANDALPGLDGLDLTVIELEGWDRSQTWEETNLEWIPPSPAITTPDAALLYPATIYFEATNLSYGRGTEMPFQVVGAPWLDAAAAAAELNGRDLPGVSFTATTITPDLLPGITVEPAYLGDTLPAIQLEVASATDIESAAVGVHLLEVIFAAASEAGVDPLSRPEWLDQLSGSTLLRAGLTGGVDAESIIANQQSTLASVTDALVAAQLYE